MTYVYILQSLAVPERYYVGITGDLRSRLQRHNAGEVSHYFEICTSERSRPTSRSPTRSRRLRSKSILNRLGRAFAKKRL